MDFQEELRWTRAQALPSVAWFALGGLAFAGLLGFFLIHRINRRMERLQAAFTTLGSGDYSARSHLEGQDELADLGRHFDAMMVRLQAGLAARAQDEAQLRATFTHLPIGLGRLSLEGAIQAVNPAFERSVALAEADLLGKDFRDFLIEGDRDVFTRIQTRCSREGLPVHEEELRWRRGDGTLAWLAVTLVHLPGFGGMPGGCLCVAADVTEAMRIGEERRALLEATSVGRLVPFRRISGQGMLELGGASGQVLGVEPEEVRRKPEFLMTLLDAEGLGQLNALIQKGGGQAHSFLARRAGSRPAQWLRWTVQVEGTTLRGVIQDVTEQQELEDRYRQSQRLESLGTLASGIAHDFNNLLTALMGSLELVAMDRNLPPNHRARIDTMGRAVQRGRALVGQLSAFGRRTGPTWGLVDLNKLVSEVYTLVKPGIPVGIDLTLQLDEKPLSGYLDESQVHQAITNLVLNARDALGDSGHITLRTSVEEIGDDRRLGQRRPGAYFCIEVVDDGPGIPEEVQSRIFEPFFTTKPVGKGTGLGLSVVYGVVDRHRGLLELDSLPGQGATFRLLLPQHDSNQTLPFSGLFQPGAPALAIASHPGETRDHLEGILEALGHPVVMLEGVRNAKAFGEIPRGVFCTPERIPHLLPWLAPGGPWQGVPWSCLGPPGDNLVLEPPPTDILPADPQVIDVLHALGHFQ
jgi:PAS domain S-box-containing protein